MGDQMTIGRQERPSAKSSQTARWRLRWNWPVDTIYRRLHKELHDTWQRCFESKAPNWNRPRRQCGYPHQTMSAKASVMDHSRRVPLLSELPIRITLELGPASSSREPQRTEDGALGHGTRGGLIRATLEPRAALFSAAGRRLTSEIEFRSQRAPSLDPHHHHHHHPTSA